MFKPAAAACVEGDAGEVMVAELCRADRRLESG
jgi:hypothetical protein